MISLKYFQWKVPVSQYERIFLFTPELQTDWQVYREEVTVGLLNVHTVTGTDLVAAG